LLDEQCSEAELDNLLAENDISESWYRYHTVSALLKGEHSANADFDFCSQVSDKIANEPAIIAAPKRAAKVIHIAERPEVRRIGGGFAIAASVAIATFFSFQTLQVADNSAFPTNQTAESQNTLSKPVNGNSDFKAVAINEEEQVELKISDVLTKAILRL